MSAEAARTTKLEVSPITRVVWASAQARANWAPKIRLASAAWRLAERESVLHFRVAAQQEMMAPEYLEVLPWVMTHKLGMRVKRWVGSASGAFTNLYQPGNGMMVVAFGRPDAIQRPEQHFGYPECCQRMFTAACPADPDPVIAWATGVQSGLSLSVIGIEQWTKRAKRITRHVEAHPLTSPLLRYIGVRAVAHIPCGPTCEHTVALGEQFLKLMGPESAQAMRDLLSLPMTWDRYRGVVLVTSPHFRIIANSTQMPDREVLHVVCR